MQYALAIGQCNGQGSTVMDGLLLLMGDLESFERIAGKRGVNGWSKNDRFKIRRTNDTYGEMELSVLLIRAVNASNLAIKYVY